jgi:hypothetical protein
VLRSNVQRDRSVKCSLVALQIPATPLRHGPQYRSHRASPDTHAPHGSRLRLDSSRLLQSRRYLQRQFASDPMGTTPPNAHARIR